MQYNYDGQKVSISKKLKWDSCWLDTVREIWSERVKFNYKKIQLVNAVTNVT